MITAVAELAHHHGTTIAELHRYLQDDLSRRIVDTAVDLRIREFILSIRVPNVGIDSFGVSRGWSPAPDALLQLGFDDLPAASAALRQLSVDLAPRSVESNLSSVFFATESTVFNNLRKESRWPAEGIEGPVKMVVRNARRPDLTVEQFEEHWRERHAPLVRKFGPDMGFARYVQSYRLRVELPSPAGWRDAPDGGITEVWWESMIAMEHHLGSAAGLTASERFAEDEKEFVNPPAMSAFLAREYSLI